jgi:flagellar motor component MotA
MANIFFYIVIICAVIIATGGFKTFTRAINALLSKKYVISAADKEKAIRLFKLIGKSVFAAAALNIIIGLMLMLHNLSDFTSLARNIAASFQAIFYSAFINLVFIYPAVYNLENRYNTEEKRVLSEKQVMDKLLMLCYKQGISPEDIIDADEISFKKYQ